MTLKLLRDLAFTDVRLDRENMATMRVIDQAELIAAAGQRRDRAHGHTISYSRKVFIPLTHLCRDVCHYCTFAHPPRKGEPAFLSRENVLDIARAGVAAGCREALFTLGDKPELRYHAARTALGNLGHKTTLSYLAEMARLVFEETGLLPHVNPGLLNADDIAALRQVSVSQGIMLESSSEHLCDRGGPHFGSPDKAPAARLETIRLAGEQRLPFTSGILIGIGETREERLEALLALRDINDRYGHIQEIIIQNFQPKPATRMAEIPAPPLSEHLWTIAMARLIFEPGMNIQAPPNLSSKALPKLIGAGINDWGGVSPVTPDHVNPEAPWPHLEHLAETTRSADRILVERLAVYPTYALAPRQWLDEKFRPAILRMIDGEGRPRFDSWRAGSLSELPVADAEHLSNRRLAEHGRKEFDEIFSRAHTGQRLAEADIMRLMSARNDDFAAVCAAADDLRKLVAGDTVSYIVTRNINYTNICYFKCQFCAFSKGKLSENLRGRPYDLPLEAVASRVKEAWSRGATEVCMQGGIHPSYTGAKYLEVCKAVKRAVPDMHIHAFSPLEVWQGASTLGMPVKDYLGLLKEAGLGTLPGTAAEILDDEVRADICPDKINTAEWIDVMRAAHALGIRSTATIMFGHIERYAHVARHLLRIRNLQEETGGFTEFVPLPFIHMETPIYLKGHSRQGPTFREAVLLHAVSRLVLHPYITNIQTSWVKMGRKGAHLCLSAGANDLGGTLMNETISRSAGASYGQEMTPLDMEAIIAKAGRIPRLRNTLYGDARQDHSTTAFADNSCAS